MSNVVDQYAVQMKFDNADFENKVSSTISALEKFKSSLASLGHDAAVTAVSTLGGSVKDIQNGFGELGSAVQNVTGEFTAMDIVFAKTIANMTDQVEKFAAKMVNALTLEPVKLGFQEYETQINAVQTILSNTKSKGTTIDDVNKALDELNLYADKTIYNFTQMTDNIGRFTAAGLDLDTSVSAIQGIANLAAMSGSTSQQASTAMYQLSQALSSGTVKLQDWNSVVNAGMGGSVFKNALIESSKALIT